MRPRGCKSGAASSPEALLLDGGGLGGGVAADPPEGRRSATAPNSVSCFDSLRTPPSLPFLHRGGRGASPDRQLSAVRPKLTPHEPRGPPPEPVAGVAPTPAPCDRRRAGAGVRRLGGHGLPRHRHPG